MTSNQHSLNRIGTCRDMLCTPEIIRTCPVGRIKTDKNFSLKKF
jgi:hypothetical protein